ncbi:MAG: chemotaxis protein CheW, partial [Bdellovibrionales bacterium]|nr:chemotaxis protein CheW [Bdellovibrionales bacterium]
LLLVDIGVRGSFAIPLTAVYRLEKLKTSRIQIAQGQKIVKYDGRPLYIKLLKEELGFSQDNNVLNKDEVKVVVVKDQDSLWGFVVNDIRDIITTSSRIEDYVSDRPHIMGGIEHDGKTVTLVDIYYILSGFRTEDSQPLDHRIEAA